MNIFIAIVALVAGHFIGFYGGFWVVAILIALYVATAD